jgi:hypothetical protein
MKKLYILFAVLILFYVSFSMANDITLYEFQNILWKDEEDVAEVSDFFLEHIGKYRDDESLSDAIDEIHAQANGCITTLFHMFDLIKVYRVVKGEEDRQAVAGVINNIKETIASDLESDLFVVNSMSDFLSSELKSEAEKLASKFEDIIQHLNSYTFD